MANIIHGDPTIRQWAVVAGHGVVGVVRHSHGAEAGDHTGHGQTVQPLSEAHVHRQARQAVDVHQLMTHVRLHQVATQGQHVRQGKTLGFKRRAHG